MLEYSPKKIINRMFITMNVNPDTVKKTPEELQQNLAASGTADRAQDERTMGAAAMLEGGPKNSEGQAAGVASGPGTGGSPMAATINQQAKPATGMPGNA